MATKKETGAATTATEATDLSGLAAALLATNPVGTRAWLDIMAESARFIAERLQEDVEAQQAMLHCTNPAELVELQAQFMQKAVEQYSAEALRMFSIMAGATVDIAEDVQKGHKHNYDDVPV